MKILIFSTLLFVATVGYTYCLSPFFLCPPEEKLKPCECVKECEQCIATFVCANLTTQTQLDEVLSRSGDFPFRIAVFEDSVLQYIPHTVFEAKQFRRLVIKNSHLSTLIDDSIQGNSTLFELWMGNVHIQRGFRFQSFSSFKVMNSLYVEKIEIKRILNDISKYLSPKMVYLQFIKTKTSRLGNKAFAEFSNLDLVVIKQGLITTVSGSMFPISLTQLVLSENRIRSLPAGFADQLPNLERLFLDGNQLSYLEESVFGHIASLTYLNLEDNPIKCDCTLRWKLAKTQLEIEGKCIDPKDKRIADITAEDLEYC